MRVQPGTMQARRRRCAMQRRHRGSYRAIRLSPRQGQALRAKFRHVFVFPARGAGSAGDCEPVLSSSTVAVFLFSILNYSPSEREKCTLEKRTRPWSRPRHAGGAAQRAASSRPLCVAPTVSAAPNWHPTTPRVALAHCEVDRPRTAEVCASERADRATAPLVEANILSFFPVPPFRGFMSCRQSA